MVPDLGCRIRAVEQEGRARRRGPEHVEALQKRELVAGHEIGPVDEVRRVNRPRAEAQVRNGDRAGLLRVVNEIPLGVVVGLFADDLNGILVRPHSAVRAQSVEDGTDRGRVLRGKARIVFQAGVRYVIDDADREVVLGPVLCQLFKDPLDHGGRELFRRKAVAAAHDTQGRTTGDSIAVLGFVHCRQHVQIEWFAETPWLLGPIQDADRPHRLGQGCREMLHRKGAVQMDLQEADFLPLLYQSATAS